jgi:hypothetical protein
VIDAVFRRLRSVFVAPLIIDVRPETFTFRAGRETLSVDTYLTVKTVGGQVHVASVGEVPRSDTSCVRIDLFANPEIRVGGVEREDALHAYMRFCIEKMHRRRRMLMPDVTITNATSPRGLLCGYEKLVLREAVMRMGARTCRWGAGCD